MNQAHVYSSADCTRQADRLARGLSDTDPDPDPRTDPYWRSWRLARWNRPVRFTDEPSKLRHKIPEWAAWTRADHDRISRVYLDRSNVLRRVLERETTDALTQYGSHGPLVSGCIRSHFPEHVRDRLRILSWSITIAIDRAHAHHRAAGRRQETWQQARERAAR